MNFPKFWAKGEARNFFAWGWSNTSLMEARASAQRVAQRIAERFERGDLQRGQRYDYGERPLREEVLREFNGEAASPRAVITRNSYGCLVLNTAQLLFVDVDLGEAPKVGGFLNRLFGSEKAVAAHAAARKAVLDQAENWVRHRPGWNWRIYDTRAGLRLAATHQPFHPSDPQCVTAFQALNADPLYRKLCENQRCFRARLTPKPWRCNTPRAPALWPFEDERAKERFAGWEKQYLANASEHATCAFVADVGSRLIAPALADLIHVHDEVTRCTSGLTLA